MSKVHAISNALTRLTAKVKRLEETGEIALASCCYEHEKALRAVLRKLTEYRQESHKSLDILVTCLDPKGVEQALVQPLFAIVNEALRLKVKP